MLHERGAHAFDGHKDDVAPFGRAVAVHGAQVVFRAAVNVVNNLPGLSVGQSRVEAAEIQLVFNEGVVELIRAVGLQFIDIYVSAVLETGVEMQHSDCRDHAGEVCGGHDRFPAPSPQRVRADDVVAEEVPREQQGGQKHAGHQRPDGIGFHDVADHLVGIDQVIDGDEIIAHPEFVPEEIFAHAVEKDRTHIEGDQDGGPHECPAAADRGDEEPQGETPEPEARQGGNDRRYDASVVVENGVEESNVAE